MGFEKNSDLLTKEDILADDWEVEEPAPKTVTITYEDLEKAFRASTGLVPFEVLFPPNMIARVAKVLGILDE